MKVKIKRRNPLARAIVGRNRVHKDRKHALKSGERMTNADIWRIINVGV